MRCSKAKFIQHIMDVSISWSERIGKPTSRTQADYQAPAIDTPPAITTPTSFHLADIASPRAAHLHDASSTSSSPPPCHHIGSSADASPYDSAEEGAAMEEDDDREGAAPSPACEEDPGLAPAGLNAGEAVDMSLHEHWAGSVPGLRVDACELEQFGRSKSF